MKTIKLHSKNPIRPIEIKDLRVPIFAPIQKQRTYSENRMTAPPSRNPQVLDVRAHAGTIQKPTPGRRLLSEEQPQILRLAALAQDDSPLLALRMTGHY
jgi:hypothetical protein